MAEEPPPQAGAWERIKRHKVVQWTVAYAAVAFALLQGFDIIAGTFDWAAWSMRAITVLGVTGVPVVALLAWHHGHLGRQRVTMVEIAGLVAILAVGGGAMWWAARGTERDVVAPTRRVDSAPPFAPPSNSVAVLAFANISGSKDDEYFSDGLSEELLNTLVRINKLQVAARASSFSFKGTATDIQTVGRKLNVAAVLEGSVRRAGDRVRISAQLVNAVTGFNLWSESYDRDFKDAFTLQSEIAIAVAGALKAKLVDSDAQRLGAGGSRDARAVDLFLRGRQAMKNSAETAMREAVGNYDAAIEIDPAFANAHAGRAVALASLYNAWLTDPDERRRAASGALAAARRAIELAPNSAEGHLALSVVLGSTTLDIAAIEIAARHAVEVEPGNAGALIAYAAAARPMRRPDVLTKLDRALILDPFDSVVHYHRTAAFTVERRWTEAREAARMLLATSKDPEDRYAAGWVELAAGNPQAALPYCEGSQASWHGQICLAIARHKLGRKAEAENIAQQLKRTYGDALASNFAQMYAQWGRVDEALDWIERAWDAQDPGLIDMQVDPVLDPIREQPRFIAVLKKMNFPP